MRNQVVADAKKRPKLSVPPIVKETAKRVEKVSFGWAKLIARIYEINPLVCECGKELKIITFVTHPLEIRRLLSRIGWPTAVPVFDPPYERPEWDVCQLLSGTEDGFSHEEIQIHSSGGPDPPFIESYSDPPHCDDHSDLPHWED